MIQPNGMCAGCLQPTDTALATLGEAEWHMAFASNLGWTFEQAEAGLPIRDGRYPVQWRVCTSCVLKITDRIKPVLVIPGAELPVIGQAA
jgi:hypothetical protein